MDIYKVRYFHVFADTGSLVKASEILHISQPALSKSLRLLESEVGLKLIEPDGRGLKLTANGAKFRTETAGLLEQWLKVPEKIRQNEVSTPTRFASFEVFTTYFLSHLIQYMEIDGMEVHELGPGSIERAIAEAQVDLGVTYLPVPVAGVDFVEVGKIKMGVYGIADVFKSKEFSELPFAIPLLPAAGTPSKMIGLDGWPDHKFERKIRYRVTMMESAMELCRKGHSVAYLPEFVVRLHNENVRSELRLRELESPVAQKDRMQSVFLVQRRGGEETGHYRQMAKCLRALK